MYYNITECVPINESISGGYRPGRGWPAYKRMSVEQMEEIMEETPLTPRYDTLPGKSVDNAQKRSTETPKGEAALMKALYGEINSIFNSYVMRIIDNYEYMDSPIYSADSIDRETLAQIVDGVIRLAEEEKDEAEEITLEDGCEEPWSRLRLLKNVIEAIVLSEIFSVRRPNYKRVMDNYVYRGGKYDGVRER